MCRWPLITTVQCIGSYNCARVLLNLFNKLEKR